MSQSQITLDFDAPLPENIERFDGETFEPERDGERLSAQLVRVREVMVRGRWCTIPGLQRYLERKHYPVKFPQQSISARIRDLRKERFGRYTVERVYSIRGIWKYRIPKQ